jgi:NADH-quinone oxidoreductase subunit N
VLFSIVAVFFYVRLIVLMFFVDGDGDAASVVRPSLLTGGTILVGALATVVLGVLPGPVLTLAAHAGEFIR